MLSKPTYQIFIIFQFIFWGNIFFYAKNVEAQLIKNDSNISFYNEKITPSRIKDILNSNKLITIKFLSSPLDFSDKTVFVMNSHIQSLWFLFVDLTADYKLFLGNIENLKELFIAGGRLDDSVWDEIKKNNHLDTLVLLRVDYSDSILTDLLQATNLQYLCLGKDEKSDLDYTEFSKIPNLRHFVIYDDDINQRDIKNIVKSSTLKELELRHCIFNSDKDIQNDISEGNYSCQSLSLTSCENTGNFLDKYSSLFPNIEELSIQLGDNMHLCIIPPFKKLKRLFISIIDYPFGSIITDSMLNNISLEEITIYCKDIDEILFEKMIKELPNLKKISVNTYSHSEKFIDHLKQKYPKIIFEFHICQQYTLPSELEEALHAR